ncbi:MAG: hypothetical protein MUF46_06825 [Desulfobacterales bacterium]|jgi:hypothetical protein|nr:hypothetical protein [Desulfobacterales bacterium]
MNTPHPAVTARSIFALILCVLLIASCQSMDAGDTKKAVPRLPDVREFDDVLVPREMEVNRDASFVYRGTSLPTGLLRLAGPVEATSLMRYFEVNLPKDGWKQVSRFRAPQSLMVFQKAERMCIIAIEDSTFRTFMDIWVVPLNDSVDTGIRK